jgi:parallel beta-helix repeat protein
MLSTSTLKKQKRLLPIKRIIKQVELIMRILITVLFLTATVCLSGNTYFVATNGNDSAPGTISAPWATWQKAFTTATAGDTVYFRGGIYFTSNMVQGTRSGARNAPVCYLNYPGEIPVLDGINKTTASHGLYIDSQHDLRIKGLTVRNNHQIIADDDASGIVVSNSNNIIMENCITHGNGKRGFFIFEPDTISVFNCDAYNNADALQSVLPGTGGDGFMVGDNGSADDTMSYVTIDGCRSWNNSDDGFDLGSEGFVGTRNCWSWNNGYLNGSGNGYKFRTRNILVSNRTTRRAVWCLAAYNKSNGFTTWDNNGLSQVMQIFNNTSYRNGVNPNRVSDAYGFYIYLADMSNQSENLKRVFKNNLAYGNYTGEVFAESQTWYLHEYNSWDLPLLAIADNDFKSVDPTGLSGPRQADGSLPVSDFLRLSPTSDLIDAGIVIPGLPYFGTAPDPGMYEYRSQSGVNNVPAVVLTSPACGSTFAEPASVSIIADAADADGVISKVEFFANSVKLGEKISVPWSFIWNNVNEGTYSLVAVATDNEGAKSTSASVLIMVRDTTETNIQIFPNPSSGPITIVFEDASAEESDLDIFDLKGVTVYKSIMMADEIIHMVDLSYLPGGIYIVRIIRNNKSYYSKVIIF